MRTCCHTVFLQKDNMLFLRAIYIWSYITLKLSEYTNSLEIKHNCTSAHIGCVYTFVKCVFTCKWRRSSTGLWSLFPWILRVRLFVRIVPLCLTIRVIMVLLRGLNSKLSFTVGYILSEHKQQGEIGCVSILNLCIRWQQLTCWHLSQ